MKTLLALALATAASFAADTPREILLWPGGAPGSEGKSEPEKGVTGGNGERSVSSVHKPSITPFLPAMCESGVGL